MSRKQNPHGTRLERENKLAADLGLGTGRSMVGAMLSAYESGTAVTIEFCPPGSFSPVRYTASLKVAPDDPIAVIMERAS